MGHDKSTTPCARILLCVHQPDPDGAENGQCQRHDAGRADAKHNVKDHLQVRAFDDALEAWKKAQVHHLEEAQATVAKEQCDSRQVVPCDLACILHKLFVGQLFTARAVQRQDTLDALDDEHPHRYGDKNLKAASP